MPLIDDILRLPDEGYIRGVQRVQREGVQHDKLQVGSRPILNVRKNNSQVLAAVHNALVNDSRFQNARPDAQQALGLFMTNLINEEAGTPLEAGELRALVFSGLSILASDTEDGIDCHVRARLTAGAPRWASEQSMQQKLLEVVKEYVLQGAGRNYSRIDVAGRMREIMDAIDTAANHFVVGSRPQEWGVFLDSLRGVLYAGRALADAAVIRERVNLLNDDVRAVSTVAASARPFVQFVGGDDGAVAGTPSTRLTNEVWKIGGNLLKELGNPGHCDTIIAADGFAQKVSANLLGFLRAGDDIQETLRCITLPLVRGGLYVSERQIVEFEIPKDGAEESQEEERLPGESGKKSSERPLSKFPEKERLPLQEFIARRAVASIPDRDRRQLLDSLPKEKWAIEDTIKTTIGRIRHYDGDYDPVRMRRGDGLSEKEIKELEDTTRNVLQWITDQLGQHGL